MEFKQITDLIKLVSKSDLIEFRLKEGDTELTILTNKHGKSSASMAKPGIKETQVAVPTYVPPPPAQDPLQSVPTFKEDAAKAESAEPEKSDYLEIRSPMVGTFYRSASPDKPPYIKVGDTIEKGAVVCIIEAMKLFNEIESEISGKVAKVMVEDATPVEYDQVLFLIEP